MKAVTFLPPKSGVGKPEIQVIDVPNPEVKDGEILVRIYFAGLHYSNSDIVRGDRNERITEALKSGLIITGIEMAGIAKSSGARISEGESVFGYTDVSNGPFFHAEFVALPETKMARVPDNFSLEGAASVIGGALTSITALERVAKLESGQDVLITGASGSVGITGVHLATHIGACVTATCHSSQIDYVRGEGAAEAFAYDRNESPEAAAQFDLVYDAAPAFTFATALGYLKPGGMYITSRPDFDAEGYELSKESQFKWGHVWEIDTDEERMERLRTLMEQGAFREAIDSIHPLERAKDAFDRQLRTGKRGKILIDFR